MISSRHETSEVAEHFSVDRQMHAPLLADMLNVLDLWSSCLLAKGRSLTHCQYVAKLL